MIAKQALLDLVTLCHDLSHRDVFSIDFNFLGLRDSFILTVRLGLYDSAKPPAYFELDENIMPKMTADNLQAAHVWLLERYDAHTGIIPL